MPRDDDSSRTEILRAAAEIFMDLGFKATTIDAIAERLGCTKGRIYYHFNSKAEIYFEVQRLAMMRLLEVVEPIARSEGPAEERLARMAFAHVDIILRELPLQKVAVHGLQLHHFSTSAARYTAQVREILALRDGYEQIFAELIDEGIRAGSFIPDLPARLLVKPFFGALNWVTVWYRPRRLQTDADIHALVTMLTEYAMRGLRAEEAS